MTHEERVIVVGRLQEWFQKRKALPLETELGSVSLDPTTRVNHLASMLPQIEQFVAQRNSGKADRWIGFVQGALWDMGHFSIDDFRKMNTFD